MTVIVKIENNRPDNGRGGPHYVARDSNGSWHTYGSVADKPDDMEVPFYLYGKWFNSCKVREGGTRWIIELSE